MAAGEDEDEAEDGGSKILSKKEKEKLKKEREKVVTDLEPDVSLANIYE